ncbi:hypothetical protein [Gracilibacillus salinarum]|uniref:DUF4145 domain-containing protein n=1 Tax=Gracilibacillus salinarum TaxID=2932255 RepID=A0ABY4GNC3_9BACI|nr:hypothetical protein [Gracilibacillus salinarum]UOQ85701.1 hypothetical protein MUN87_01990 [Gracilibacillus salinarum]
MELSKIESDYLEAGLDEFLKEKQDFLNKTEHEEIQMVILRVHLYIEKEMIRLTEIFLKHPQKFKGLNFKSRLDLLYGVGVIDKEIYDPIDKINTIRNSISHGLNYEFNKEEYKKIYDSLSNDILKEYKKDLQYFSKAISFSKKTRVLLLCVWVNLQSIVSTPYFTLLEIGSSYKILAYEEIEKYKKESF